MLVLTRKIQESVVVGGSDRFQRILKVKVLEIRGDKVKLGFDVEADVPVHRLEVWERICGERAAALHGDPKRRRAIKMGWHDWS